MRKVTVALVLLTMGSAAGSATAQTAAQSRCDQARIAAWGKYEACINAAVAREARDLPFDVWKAFWKCRKGLFKAWAGFQPKAALGGSTCVGNRFTDNGLTITDQLTGLEWEKKTDDGSVHSRELRYTWSTGFPGWRGDGSVYATFLTGSESGLNVAEFAGSRDWRLPTLAELQTLLRDYPCRGQGGGNFCVWADEANPSVDPGFAGLDPNTQADGSYWSSTGYAPAPSVAWSVHFDFGSATRGFGGNKDASRFARAVRGGL